MKIRPIIWQAYAEAAKVLGILKHQHAADAKCREAQAMIDEMAGMFPDTSMRMMFVENATQRVTDD